MVASTPPIIFVITPLRPLPGDPGWPGSELGSYTENRRWSEEELKRFRAAAFAANVKFAEMICRDVALAGGAPFAPHLLFTRFLDDDVVEERELGMRSGRRVLMVSDEAWSVLPTWRGVESGGMRDEIQGAHEFGVPILRAREETLAPLLERLRHGAVKLRGRMFT